MTQTRHCVHARSRGNDHVVDSRPPIDLKSQPVELGQTRTGYVLAAALLVLWLIERPVAAETIWGSNEDQHIRISWYHFGHFYGRDWSAVLFELKDDPTDGLHPLRFRNVTFSTLGLPFELLGLPQYWTLVGPYPTYDLGDQTVYDYRCLAPSPDPWSYGTFLSASGLLRHEGVGLFDTRASYTIEITPDDGSGGVRSIYGTLDFVSVQTIPEPPSAGFGLLGAAAGAVRRLRRKQGKENGISREADD